MDFNLKKGLINGHIGSFFYFFFMWPFLLCVVPWVIYFMFGVVWVLDFFFFLVISICTELFLFWEGNWNNLQLNNCYWKIWWP